MMKTPWAVAFFATVFASLADAQDSVLLDVQSQKQGDAILYSVDFGVSLYYVRHLPYAGGNVLQIQLRAAQAIDPSAANAAANTTAALIARRESLAPATRVDEPIAFLTYEGNVPGGPYLTLRFKWPVSYTVQEGPGAKSILVRVERLKVALPSHVIKGAKTTGDSKLDQLMSDAVKALAENDNARAIVYLSRILELPANAYSEQAKELVGLARERKGDFARAKIEYLEYLRLYPNGAGANRVNERLSGIEMSLAQAAAEPIASETPPISYYTRWSQRYSRDHTDLNSTSTATEFSSITSGLNASLRGQSNDYEYYAYADAQQVHSLDNGSAEHVEVNALYVQGKSKVLHHSLVAGRQSSGTTGIVGRADAVWGTYEFAPRLRVGALAGRPAEPLPDGTAAERRVGGVSAEYGAPADPVQLHVYSVRQSIEQRIDRRAVGGDLRYLQSGITFFGTVDYDTEFDALNIFSVTIGRQIGATGRFDLTYDRRLSPIVQLGNAAEQEGAYDFTDLFDEASAAEMRAKAQDLSIATRRWSFNYVDRYSEQVYVYAEVSRIETDARPKLALLWPLTEVPTSEENFIPAIDGYGPEYTYSMQAVASNMFVQGNSQTWGVRCTIGGGRSSQAIFTRANVPLGEGWYFGPRAQYDRTHTHGDDGVALKTMLGIRIDYRWSKRVRLDADLTYENNQTHNTTAPNDYARTLVFLGYSVDF